MIFNRIGIHVVRTYVEPKKTGSVRVFMISHWHSTRRPGLNPFNNGSAVGVPISIHNPVEFLPNVPPPHSLHASQYNVRLELELTRHLWTCICMASNMRSRVTEHNRPLNSIQ